MKKVYWIGLVFTFQFAVLGWMMADNESVRTTGELMRLELRVRDPYDPFRGNYLQLNFEHETVANKGFKPDVFQEYWIRLQPDTNGMARPVDVSMQEQRGPGWLKVINDAGRILNDKQQEVLEFRYPFDRYFMNEDRIREAEERLGRIRSDTLLKAWAEIRVKHGKAVITALKLNGENIGQRQ